MYNPSRFTSAQALKRNREISSALELLRDGLYNASGYCLLKDNAM